MAKTNQTKPIISKEKDDNNPLVIINLDRPRVVRFGHKALKLLGVLSGKALEDVNANKFDLEELEKIMFCGLLADSVEHGENLKLEDMEDLLDQAESQMDIIEAMNLALNKAFQQTKKQKN